VPPRAGDTASLPGPSTAAEDLEARRLELDKMAHALALRLQEVCARERRLAAAEVRGGGREGLVGEDGGAQAEALRRQLAELAQLLGQARAERDAALARVEQLTAPCQQLEHVNGELLAAPAEDWPPGTVPPRPGRARVPEERA
jgi:hypothetical protein